MPRLYQCTRRTFTLVTLIQHVGSVHAHEPNFSIVGGVRDWHWENQHLAEGSITTKCQEGV